jgi:hypothetical protein
VAAGGFEAAAVALGLVAGVSFIAFGAWVVSRRSPTRVGVPLASFAVAYGVYLVAFRLAPGPEGFGWLGEWVVPVGQVASGLGGVALLVTVHRLVGLGAERDFSATWLCVGGVTLAFLNFWFVYAYVTPGITAQEVIGPPLEGGLQLLAGFGAYAVVLALAWSAVFGLREAGRIPRAAALALLALVPAEGLFYGWYLMGDAHASAAVVVADLLMLLMLFGVGAAWLRGILGRPTRIPRVAGLAFFAFPLLGMLSALPDEPWATAASSALVGAVGILSVALLVFAVRKQGLLDAAPHGFPPVTAAAADPPKA